MREEMPADWSDVKLGALGRFVRGKGGTKTDERPEGLACIRYGELYTRHDCIVRAFYSFISPDTASAYTPLKCGDVLFAGSGETLEEIGKAAAYCGVEPAYAGADTIIFQPGDSLDPRFTGYAVNGVRANQHKSRMGQGSSVMHISAEHLGRLPLRLPPRAQQQCIGEILTTVDDAIEQTEALIAKTQQIKAGLMHDLFTRGVTPDGELRPPRSEAPQLYKESPLGWIPKGWGLDELRRRLSGISYGFTNPMPETEDGPYMVTAADVLDGRIQYDTCRRTSDLAFERLLTQKSRPKVGDVLLTKDGTLGRLAIVDRERVCINQSVAVLRPRDVSDSQFLAALLGSPRWQQRMVLDAGGSTIKHIYITIVDKMLVSWPPTSDERAAIVDRLEACGVSVDLETANRWKLDALKRGLMHDLLTGRVRVSSDDAGDKR